MFLLLFRYSIVTNSITHKKVPLFFSFFANGPALRAVGCLAVSAGCQAVRLSGPHTQDLTHYLFTPLHQHTTRSHENKHKIINTNTVDKSTGNKCSRFNKQRNIWTTSATNDVYPTGASHCVSTAPLYSRIRCGNGTVQQQCRG